MNRMPGWRPPMAGHTPFFVAAAEPRFPYCLYIPKARPPGPAPLLIGIHGSDRRPELLRDILAPLCDRTGAVLLAPLFAIGSTGPDDEPGYKFGLFNGVRYDRALLAMVDDAARRLPLAIDRFAMAGFSGGAQLVLRFMMLQPQRLHAVSIGAPGYVTLLDPSLPWWAGTADFETIFGHPLDTEAIRRIAIHLAIGGSDTETEEIRVPEGHPLWVRGVEKAGPTRISRIEALDASLRAAGCSTQLDYVPNVAHATKRILPVTAVFLEKQLLARDVRPAAPAPS
ncbi:alpha/beta hydrolase [Neoroseomonas lacus]|uniref:Uncharacterized protein n=1 Tax=Neoroseomonas lacus TaxID=287609 RepID=A0A917KRG7_9PROT|nr:alpha/beta hydrolase [Neoroseomonas lacus]GGJ20998.1 hypothetical protein GCM10011320_30340 [Neoroseomonas lacus]